ncbi:MAG: hypothetical protein HC855_11650 [Rhizobiales bacterium]|nr:hypothetical protein [Hyphomicrobiales bacterium]
MSDMSPLSRILMRIMRAGSWGAGAALLLFAGLLVYQRYTPEGFAFQKGDFAFLSVLAVLMLLALYLVRGIRKELDGDGG